MDIFFPGLIRQQFRGERLASAPRPTDEPVPLVVSAPKPVNGSFPHVSSGQYIEAKIAVEPARHGLRHSFSFLFVVAERQSNATIQ